MVAAVHNTRRVFRESSDAVATGDVALRRSGTLIGPRSAVTLRGGFHFFWKPLPALYSQGLHLAPRLMRWPRADRVVPQQCCEVDEPMALYPALRATEFLERNNSGSKVSSGAKEYRQNQGLPLQIGASQVGTGA